MSGLHESLRRLKKRVVFPIGELTAVINRNVVFAIALATVLAQPMQASYGIIESVSAASSDNNTITTGSIDTTGATLCIMAVATGAFAVTPATVEDSKGSTWNAKTAYSNGTSGHNVQLFWAGGATLNVGSGHTFTATETGGGPSVIVACFSGAASSPDDQENGNNNGSGPTVQPGSITPSEDNTLVVSATSSSETTSWSVDSSMIEPKVETLLVVDQHYSLSFAYIIQTTASAINPTWTKGDGAGYSVANIASFKAAAVAGTCRGGAMMMGVGGC